MPLLAPEQVRRAGVPPVPATSLIGREADVLRVLGLFDSGHRLVTLTGTGGIGKTRLAIEIAARQERDTIFVGLASLTDASLILPAIAEALGAISMSPEYLPQTVAAALADRWALLVLDNYEHVLAGANLAQFLVESDPGVRILVTSRARLDVSGEVVYPLEPLAVPTAGSQVGQAEIVAASGVQLFLERTRMHHPAFVLQPEHVPVIRRICERLDGLPLAIELAARRAHLLAPDELLARLEPSLHVLGRSGRDMPVRHGTLRSTVAWSVDLLPAEERAWWVMLGVFRGGCTAQAARAVAAAIGLQGDDVEILPALVDAGLVRQVTNRAGEPRFTMFETTREFALEALVAMPNVEAVRQAHAGWFVSQAPVYQAGITGPDTDLWQMRIDADMPNVRQAVEWLLAHDRLDDALDLVGRLEWHWSLPHNLIEGRAWCDRLLPMIDASNDPSRVATLQGTAAVIADWQADTGYAIARLQEALALWRTIGNDEAISNTLLSLASTALDQDRLDDALAYVLEALEIANRGDRVWSAASANNLTAVILNASGQPAKAIQHYEAALRLYERGGHRAHMRSPLQGLGDSYTLLGLYATALDYLDSALDRCSVEELYSHTPAIFQGFAAVAVATRAYDKAVPLLAAVQVQRDQLGTPSRPFKGRQWRDMVESCRQHLPVARFGGLWDTGQHAPLAALFELARSIEAADAHETEGLSRRELDVLALMTEGASDAEIADTLFITRRTASKHVASILMKLDAPNRTAAATMAIRKGLV